jgi:hypothetical protein
MKYFNVNGETFGVTQTIIEGYHNTQDKYIWLIDSMVDQNLDIGVAFIDENKRVARQVEKVENYIISKG